MRLLVGLIINTAALLLVAKIIPGIFIMNLSVAVVAAFILVVFNTFLKPLIVLVTLPLNLLTLGIFTFFINGFLFYLVSKFVSGFVIYGFWSAFWGAIVFGIINYLLNIFFNPWRKLKVNFYGSSSSSRASRGNIVEAEIIKENTKLGGKTK